jgi:hypothetical protein
MIDRYTKAILTVIAVCLLWLCAQPVIRPVPVRAAGTYVTIDGLSPFLAAIPVKIVDSPLPVDIERVSSARPIEVTMKEK